MEGGTSRRPPAEPLPLSGGTLVGHHPGHAGNGQAIIRAAACSVVVPVLPVRVGHYGAAADLAHPYALWPEDAGGGHWHGHLYEVRELDGPLQRLLAADGTTRHEGEPPDTKGIEQAFLGPHHIPDGDHGKTHPVGTPATGRQGCRARAARATPEHVGADHEVSFGVDSTPRPDHGVPPAAAFVRRVRAS